MKSHAGRLRNSILLGAALLSTFVAPGSASAETPVGDRSTRVSRLFDRWTGPKSPGCAVSIVQSQAILFQAAYGSAVIETNTPNTTATAFQLASLSKQFTAFAIHLLKEEGKLSLGDDVRKYIPELHNFGHPITIGHLLHHTSGIRDLSVGALKGRFDPEVTQQSVLRTLFDQRELNFTPGSRFSYSNSNYALLALIAERVSGQSLDVLLTERLFQPLGMKNSYVQGNLRKILVDQAWPYGQGQGMPERALHIYANYGSTNLRSTAEDMALWMMNLDRPKVGSPALITAMLETARDSAGRQLSYASGLEVGEHRGARTVDHSGIDPGYASHFLTFPDHHFGVTVMCNTEVNETRSIAYQIADIYLGDRLAAAKGKQQAASVVLTDKQLRRFPGSYKEPGGMLFAVEMRNGKLFIQGNDEMVPIGESEFALQGQAVRFSFASGTADGPATTLTVHDPGMDRKAARIEKATIADLTPLRMRDYEGAYYSPELHAIVRLEARQDALWLIGPDYETRVLQPPQLFREADSFSTQHLIGALRFIRNKQGRVTELTASNGRFENLRFLKLGKLPKL